MTGTPRQPVFCTACGEQLEEFCFSPDARDLEALRAAALRCHLEGRHTGGMCAKLYIADDAHPAQPGADAPSDAPGIDEDAIRAAVLARIAGGGGATPEERASGPPDPT